jgi:hypothetical protein
MSDLKDKANETIGKAAAVTRKAASKVIDKSKDVAHSAGKVIERQGRKLKNV